MQFQSDMLGITVGVPDAEELSGIGAAYKPAFQQVSIRKTSLGETSGPSTSR